jgi:HEAT repeat protein
MDPQVEQHIANLQDTDPDVHYSAANALGEIGENAITDLADKLKYGNETMRRQVTDTSWQSSSAPEIFAQITTRKNEDEFARQKAADALAKIGIPAVPFLLEASKSANASARRRAIEALQQVGDSVALPRRILAYSPWSAQDRTSLLEKLRLVQYDKHDLTVLYQFPDTFALCQAVLKEEDVAARAGVQEVLNWLLLLRCSDADPSKQSEELVRPVRGGEPDAKPDTLLRAGQEPEKKGEDVPPQASVWQRLFRKRKREAPPETASHHKS